MFCRHFRVAPLLLALLLFTQGCATAEIRALDAAPGFVGPDLSGNVHTFAPETIKKPILLVFWASWCTECRYEVPEILDLLRENGGKLEALGVTVDKNPERARAWVARANIPYENVIDSTAEISERFGVRATPTVLLIGQDGTVTHVSHRIDRRFKEEVAKLVNRS